MMEYISVVQFAEKHGISERTVRNYCSEGKIPGTFITGKTWNIPADAVMPKRRNVKEEKLSPLLRRLREEMGSGLKGGIYHRTQIDFTYNSNHIEGSKLTHEQTRYIFETNTIGAADEILNVDDIVETVNHFRCVDFIIARADSRLTEDFIKQLHSMLKTGTADSRKDWFEVGAYKRLPNEVGGIETCPPEQVRARMKELLSEYNAIKSKSFDDILDFHVRFERIHPFQDGNGRIGRLLMFKECIANRHVPFIITEELKAFYYRGLGQWGHTNGYLKDTCLAAQDQYKVLLDYFRIKY